MTTIQPIPDGYNLNPALKINRNFPFMLTIISSIEKVLALLFYWVKTLPGKKNYNLLFNSAKVFPCLNPETLGLDPASLQPYTEHAFGRINELY